MSWKQYCLADIIHIKHGYAFKGEFFSEVPTNDILLTPGNFNVGGGFKANKLKYYNGEFPVDYILDENDVIVTMTDLSKEADTLGFSAKVPAWTDKRFLHNQRIGLVSLRSHEFDLNYLYWLMRTYSYQRFVANGATGATVKHTSPTKICSFNFIAPENKATQRKIASILSAYDDLIENNLKRIKLLEEQAFLTYKGVLTIEKLEQISVFDYAHIMSGGTPSTTNPNFWEGEIPFFTPKDLSSQSGYYLNDTERKLTELGLEKCNSKLFPRDTIFITARGTVGKLVLSKIPSAISQSNYAITTRNGSSNYFLFLALIDKVNHFKQLAVGGVFDTIIVDTFKMILIELPNKRIIDQFNIDIKPIFQLIDTLQKQNTKLREARDILLPKLMNGQIEV